jgi:hypothetical protein
MLVETAYIGGGYYGTGEHPVLRATSPYFLLSLKVVKVKQGRQVELGGSGKASDACC